MSEAERLVVLLHHGCEHSQAHGREMARWALRARAAGLEEVAAQIDEAAAIQARATDCLRHGLGLLTRPADEPPTAGPPASAAHAAEGPAPRSAQEVS